MLLRFACERSSAIKSVPCAGWTMAFGPTGHSYEPLREKLTQIIDQAVGLSPLQFGMSLQVAQDMAAREDSLDSAIRDNR